MKVNDELSCDVLFRNLVLLLGGSSPQGPRRRDNRRRGDGHTEENPVKDAFCLRCLCVLAQGSRKGGGNPSLTRMTCNHYTTPDNCALLVISHYFVCLSGIICYMLIAPLPSLCEWSSILFH